ncbi:ABC transporter permease subunit [Thermocatellispora tengchongensis]
MTIVRFLARRLGATLLLLLVLSFLVFTLLAASPGSPLQTLIGARPPSPELLAAVEAKYHLDQPFLVQYWHWLTGAARLDLGQSISVQTDLAVLALIGDRAAISVQLGIYAVVLVLGFGIPLGMAAGIRRGSATDRTVSFLATFCISAPPFVLSIALLYVFGVALGWFPVYGVGEGFSERIVHLTMPAAALAGFLSAVVIRQTRAATPDRDAAGLHHLRPYPGAEPRARPGPLRAAQLRPSRGDQRRTAADRHAVGGTVRGAGVLPARDRHPAAASGHQQGHPRGTGARHPHGGRGGGGQPGGGPARTGPRPAYANDLEGRCLMATIAATVSSTARGVARAPVMVRLAAAFLLLVAVLAVAGPWLAPYDPAAQDLMLNVSGPSGAHWLGTDQLGADVLSQVLAGTRAALIGPLVVALGTVVLGASLGILAGYRGGWIDALLNRLADLMYALPSLLVIIVLVGVVGGGYWFAVLVLTVLSLPSEIRLCRSATLAQARLPYIDAARTLGLPAGRIMARHLLPNIMPTVIATFLLDFVTALIGLSGLSYLGLGAPPGTPDWGTLLQSGQNLLADNPWISLAPGAMIALTATCFTLLGDWLYDRYSANGDHS